MEHLRILTDKLISTPELSYPVQPTPFSGIQVKNGTCFVWSLMGERGCAVHKWFTSKASILENYVHRSKEILTVYAGRLSVKQDGNETILQVGDTLVLLPNIPYVISFQDDSWYISITIPPAEGLPSE